MMNSMYMTYLLATIVLNINVIFAGLNAPFAFEKGKEGVELLENGISVLFYQVKPKTLTGEFFYNNYVHPLYSLTGDTLTEEFSMDHQHHRGIFWAWYHIYTGNQELGDSWIMKNITIVAGKIVYSNY